MPPVPRWDDLWLNGNLATMAETGPGAEAPYGAIEDGALAVAGGRIAWLGRRVDLPGRPEALAANVHELDGSWMTPGLIDCHTHLVHGGDRAREFELRLQGANYEEIARAGGGILTTVRATRAATQEALVAAARPRLRALLAEGVTTIEIKSGYGLDRDNELKQLRAARQLGAEFPVTVRTTFLGAHAVPPEYDGRAEAYIEEVVIPMIPAVREAGLADAVDAFCETIAFTAEQTARVFEAATAHALAVKLHADQLSDQGGAALAARFGALSADHLEYANEAGIAAMAQSGTVAVLLPGAFYVLGETKVPPVDALRQAGVPIALATDSNPGSAPVASLLLMLNMGCTLFRLTPEEALAGVTRHGARALGLGDSHGTLEVGKVADLAVWRIDQPAELAYWIGFNPLICAVKNGVIRTTGTDNR
ncbi:MAG: imidazolonepropionase [Alphaproteobacteria bacterium]|nr:MAG: imidazolonepropionase [Alphaproteobacteria bacterium]